MPEEVKKPEKRVPCYRRPEDMQEFTNPPIGTMVQWFPQADVTHESDAIGAGIVTAIEGPGIVALTVHKRNCNPLFLQGVRHVSDPFHQGKRETTLRSGGWDFLPPFTPEPWPPVRRTAAAEAAKK